jgi:hypothetical protein
VPAETVNMGRRRWSDADFDWVISQPPYDFAAGPVHWPAQSLCRRIRGTAPGDHERHYWFEKPAK